jgi:predicted N-acetyltransferase YhbS
MIEYLGCSAKSDKGLIDLFRDTFTASEGREEGDLIGALVQEQLTSTPSTDIRVFTACEEGQLIGACIFTRLCYASDRRLVFILAPMAVDTGKQRQGIGQTLINTSLQSLKNDGIDVVMTYGDPGFYGKTGFCQVSQELVPAPYPLQYPEGWLTKSLTDAPVEALTGSVTCVTALRKPVFW